MRRQQACNLLSLNPRRNTRRALLQHTIKRHVQAAKPGCWSCQHPWWRRQKVLLLLLLLCTLTWCRTVQQASVSRAGTAGNRRQQAAVPTLLKTQMLAGGSSWRPRCGTCINRTTTTGVVARRPPHGTAAVPIAPRDVPVVPAATPLPPAQLDPSATVPAEQDIAATTPAPPADPTALQPAGGVATDAALAVPVAVEPTVAAPPTGGDRLSATASELTQLSDSVSKMICEDLLWPHRTASISPAACMTASCRCKPLETPQSSHSHLSTHLVLNRVALPRAAEFVCLILDQQQLAAPTATGLATALARTAQPTTTVRVP